MELEKVICSAIYYNVEFKDENEKLEYNKYISDFIHLPKNIKNWIVIYWPRHSHCFEILYKIFENKININKLYIIQWFITTKNNFVNRNEAYKIAVHSWQLKNIVENKKWNINSDINIEKELFSEDLY